MSIISKKTLIFADTDNGGVIHVANIKGGVGKSTVATNLAATLSKRGPTLIIDLDVQGSATVALGHSTDKSSKSSWELLRTRLSPPRSANSGQLLPKIRNWLRTTVFSCLRSFKGDNPTSSLFNKVNPGFDLVPAGPDLFKTPSRFQLENLICNLKNLREYYKYIILDTPSVWNDLTRSLYVHSDLNLIPVTLNALSTKSLRDYLSNVLNLSKHNPSLRIRILKNEVFGRQNSKVKGKIRTMSENRKYLENLCEQVSFQSSSGISLLPQSLMFDLEIPESAVIRDAQDEGKSLSQYHHYSSATKAFEELSKRVQYVLNTAVHKRAVSRFRVVEAVPQLLAAAVLIAAFSLNDPVFESAAPRPLAPQQLIEPDGGVINHTFSDGESFYKVAKFAISRFRAKVPSMREINDYVNETILIYNLTRMGHEPHIKDMHSVKKGMSVTFYPPQKISNPQEKQLVPVYRYFMELVDDQHAYVTGDWCERGTGGGQPHYGIDVAGKYGSKVFSPVDGEIINKTNSIAGRTVGVLTEGTVIFFSHMDKRFFKNGEKVKKGEAIGTIGMTGRTSGPHAHIGYGIRSQTRSDLVFGKHRYRITDPKLFFYRHMYMTRLTDESER